MKRVTQIVLILLVVGPSAFAAKTAKLTVNEGKRQVYQGFGFGLINTERYANLSREQQREISKYTIEMTNANLLRIWHEDNLVQNYIDTNLLPDALDAGIDTVILAPGGNPQKIAEEILEVWQAGYTIHYTALINEPDHTKGWPTVYHTAKFRELWEEIKARGLETKLLCCDDANVDDWAKQRIDAILKDPTLRPALAAFSTHSYSMAAERDYARRVFKEGSNWWQTEHSMDGNTATPDRYDLASQTTNVFLNDLNQGVTHWMYFQGYGLSMRRLPETHNNVFLTYYDSRSFGKPVGSGWFVDAPQLHYIRQINQAFPYGTTMRWTTAKGLPSYDMVWTYGTRSPINAACGQRPDGGWAVCISNAEVAPPAGGHYYDDYIIELDIVELHGTGAVPFKLFRSGPTTGFIAEQGEIVVTDGKVTIEVKKNELVSFYTNSAPTVVKSENKSPKHFTLHPNYPNPFNASTTIRYDLPKDSYVRIEIVDASGRVINTLVNSVQSAGQKQITWDGEDRWNTPVPSGVYFVRFEYDQGVQVGKLMMIR